MSRSRQFAIILLWGLLTNSASVFAHTEIKSNAGKISNVIAVGLVILSIIIFLFINRKKK